MIKNDIGYYCEMFIMNCQGDIKICDCEECYLRSFASHPKSKQLVDKTLDARKILCSSKSKYWFDCDICGHQFQSAINNVVGLSRWCPYCCNSINLYKFV